MHILGGTENVTANTLTECLAGCTDAACQGVDFNFETNGCFEHTSATECNTLIPKTACNHFRIIDTCTGNIDIAT